MRSSEVGTIAVAILGWCLSGCAPGDGDSLAGAWAGAIDTLPSGQVDVTNPARPSWTLDQTWRIVEELRIGSMDVMGPELLGRIVALDVDALGRIWVLEGQARELRLFDGEGRHVRTVGRQGGGPEEFGRPADVEIGPAGDLWVADPGNSRLTQLDTTGVFIDTHPILPGFVIVPWPGGFDAAGRYLSPLPIRGSRPFQLALVRHDPEANFATIDTIPTPAEPFERQRWELRSPSRDGFLIASVPFSPGFQWKLSPDGHTWGMLTGEYRLFELGPSGDTLRTLSREFEPVPVTSDDLAEEEERLEWFVSQGGKIDMSQVPATKPATDDFFFDDAGHLWVFPIMPRGEGGTALDVFDAEGRYLGRIALPFRLQRRPVPIVENDMLYGVTLNELEVPFVVRARIEKQE